MARLTKQQKYLISLPFCLLFLYYFLHGKSQSVVKDTYHQRHVNHQQERDNMNIKKEEREGGDKKKGGTLIPNLDENYEDILHLEGEVNYRLANDLSYSYSDYSINQQILKLEMIAGYDYNQYDTSWVNEDDEEVGDKEAMDNEQNTQIEEGNVNYGDTAQPSKEQTISLENSVKESGTVNKTQLHALLNEMKQNFDFRGPTPEESKSSSNTTSINLSDSNLQEKQKVGDANLANKNSNVTASQPGIASTAPHGPDKAPAKDLTSCMKVELAPKGTFPLIGLISFPGSGNTWARYIIERASGFYSGSRYRDGGLYKGGFLGEMENCTDGRTIVVKSHQFPWEEESYVAAVLVIRNPYEALLSEFNRRFSNTSNKHISHVPVEKFQSEEWSKFVKFRSFAWLSTTQTIILKCPKVLVVYYDELKSNLLHNVRRILTFLGQPINEDRLTCTQHHNDGKFHRKKQELPFDPFTSEMKKHVNKKIKECREFLAANSKKPLPKYERAQSETS